MNISKDYRKLQEMAQAWAEVQCGNDAQAALAYSPDQYWLCVIWDGKKMPHTFQAEGALNTKQLNFELVCGTLGNFHLRRA